MRAVLRGAWVLCAVLAAGPAAADPTARVVAVGDIALVDAVLRRAREGVDPFAAVIRCSPRPTWRWATWSACCRRGLRRRRVSGRLRG